MKTKYISTQHDHVALLLPWVNTDKLTSAEQFVVEQHLKECDQCCSELKECQIVQDAFNLRAEQSQWQPPQNHFNQLLAMLDNEESSLQNSSAAIHDGPSSSAGNFWQSIHRPQNSSISGLLDKLGELPALFRWTLVVESVVLASFCLVFVLTKIGNQPTGGAFYETLTSTAGSQISHQGMTVSLVFAETMTEVEINKLLKSTGGQIVSGPSDLGVYTIELSSSKVTQVRADELLAVYRNNPNVRILEPVSNNTIVTTDERP